MLTRGLTPSFGYSGGHLRTPCAVCRTGVGNNSIYCNGCKLWVHKKCSGLQRLTPNPDYSCARCMGNAHPIDGRPQSEVQVGPDKLEVVASFCQVTCFLLVEAVKWWSLLVWKSPGRSSGSYYQFSLPATSLTRPVAMCTVLVCGAPCSMPVKLGHLPRRACSACNAI